jgi:hypothetical protein
MPLPDSCEQLTAPKTMNPKPIATRDRFIVHLVYVAHRENVPVTNLHPESHLK